MHEQQDFKDEIWWLTEINLNPRSELELNCSSKRGTEKMVERSNDGKIFIGRTTENIKSEQ